MNSSGDKALDFKLLRDASSIVNDKLRQDEAIPDLKDQFVERPVGGNHRYFLEPFHKQLNAQVVSNFFSLF